MSLLAVSIISLVAAIIFCVQLLFRQKDKDWVLDFLSVGVMAGFIAMGILAYLLAPSVLTSVDLISFYTPHAYNLIIWPLFALLILHPRFSSRLFLISFVFVYGLDEVFWNALAFLRYMDEPSVIAFMGGSGWLTFLVLMFGAIAVGYVLVMPKIRPNVSWLILPALAFLWAWPGGFPVLANGAIATAPLSYVQAAFCWELIWQSGFWLFVWRSVFPI